MVKSRSLFLFVWGLAFVLELDSRMSLGRAHWGSVSTGSLVECGFHCHSRGWGPAKWTSSVSLQKIIESLGYEDWLPSSHFLGRTLKGGSWGVAIQYAFFYLLPDFQSIVPASPCAWCPWVESLCFYFSSKYPPQLLLLSGSVIIWLLWRRGDVLLTLPSERI